MKIVKRVLAVLVCLSCVVLFFMFFQKSFLVESSFTDDPIYVWPLNSIFGYAWNNPVLDKAEMLLSGNPLIVLMGIIPLALLLIWINRWSSDKKNLWMHALSIAGIVGDYFLLESLKSSASTIADLLYGEVSATMIGYTLTRIILIVMTVLVILHAVTSFMVKNNGSVGQYKESDGAKPAKKNSGFKVIVSVLCIVAIALFILLGLFGAAVRFLANAHPTERVYTPEQQSYLELQNRDAQEARS